MPKSKNDAAVRFGWRGVWSWSMAIRISCARIWSLVTLDRRSPRWWLLMLQRRTGIKEQERKGQPARKKKVAEQNSSLTAKPKRSGHGAGPNGENGQVPRGYPLCVLNILRKIKISNLNEIPPSSWAVDQAKAASSGGGPPIRLMGSWLAHATLESHKLTRTKLQIENQ